MRDAVRPRMMKPLLRWSLAALTGCMAPTGYVYSPKGASHWDDGYPTATQLVPPEAPQGTIEVSSFGFVEIRNEQRAQSVLHVRLTVTSDGDASPWAIVPCEQIIDISGEEHTLPMAMKQALPMNEPVEIGQRERTPLDLYFALPAGVASEDVLMGFDLLWQITTPARPYLSRTHFDRYLSTDPGYGPAQIASERLARRRTISFRSSSVHSTTLPATPIASASMG